MSAGALSLLLDNLGRSLGNGMPPELLVGLAQGDDGLVWRLSPDNAIIATIDFFTPIVDDPYAYGAIAATNAMSDVFAMGGRVGFALNVAAFPRELPADVCADILRGGADKVREAGGVIGGGHTIVDREPKYGLCVIGFVHPERVLTKAGAHPGDRLYLTKPLGTGAITTAAKSEKALEEHLAGAIRSMMVLNNVILDEEIRRCVHAATDITGFGLLGHASEVALQSRIDLEIRASSVPFLEGARESASGWLFPGGTFTNLEHYASRVDFSDSITNAERHLLMTPETSGGLLLFVANESASTLEKRADEMKVDIRYIGNCVEGKGRIRVGS
jgi:selenide,water dikinase